MYTFSHKLRSFLSSRNLTIYILKMPSTQQVVLITGCSEPQSIGAAMVRDFLCRGFTVYATARKVETMKDLAVDGAKVSAESPGCILPDSYKLNIQLLALDVVDEASIRAAVDHVSAEEGRLDVLINNVRCAPPHLPSILHPDVIQSWGGR
jgi:NAD(P)-dependent dehydrogenase (short-subunit alcohol dehydrogenase family)